MTPNPPFTRRSSSRMGNGFQMSKRRKRRNATTSVITPAEASAASGRNATISSHTIEPWSAAPRSRPVISHAQTPTKKSGIAQNATMSGWTTCAARTPITTATAVPALPGATGERPGPQPSAMKCAGCETRKRASGRSGEVVVSAAIDLHGFAVRSQQAHALAALDLANAREGDAQDIGELRDAVARVGGRGEAKLVVVAARDDRGAARIRVGVLRADRRDGDVREVHRRTHA